MLRQLLACTLSFLGILLMFVFWYQIIPLQPWFLEHDWSPENFLGAVTLWCLLGGVSCLFLSKHIAAWAMKVDLLPLDQPDPKLEWAHGSLQRLAQKLGFRAVPQMGIYEKSEINAFALGVNQRHSLLVISRGALDSLSPEHLEILISRELLHLKSGDPLALSVMQGMIFAFTLYVARMLAFLLGTSLRATEEESTSSDGVEILVTGLLTLILTLPGSLVYWFYSRSSALRADAATASLVGPKAYTAFLEALPGEHALRREVFSDSFKLQSRLHSRGLGWMALHPPLALRIKRLSV